jgi:hypothetical protein
MVGYARFEAKPAVQLRTSLFCNINAARLTAGSDVSGEYISPIFTFEAACYLKKGPLDRSETSVNFSQVSPSTTQKSKDLMAGYTVTT